MSCNSSEVLEILYIAKWNRTGAQIDLRGGCRIANHRHMSGDYPKCFIGSSVTAHSHLENAFNEHVRGVFRTKETEFRTAGVVEEDDIQLGCTVFCGDSIMSQAVAAEMQIWGRMLRNRRRRQALWISHVLKGVL